MKLSLLLLLLVHLPSFAFDLYQMAAEHGQRTVSGNWYIDSASRTFNMNLLNKTTEEIDQFFADNEKRRIVGLYNPYVWYLSGHPDVAKNVFKYYLKNILKDLGKKAYDTDTNLFKLENYFQSMLDQYQEVDPAAIVALGRPTSDWNEQLGSFQYFQRMLLCLNKSFFCAKAFRKAVDLTTPVYSFFNRALYGNNATAALKLYQAVLAEKRYHRPALLVAIKLIQKIRTYRLLGRVQGNIWKDVYQAVELELGDKFAATDMSFDLLGLYGTRGASFLSYDKSFINTVNTPVFYAISFLAHAISYLDLQGEHGAESYGYPGLNNDYYYGKHYRFWLPAYVAYKLRRASLPKGSAFDGSYLLALMYEMFANAGARRERAELSEDHYSLHSNGVRFSIMYTAFGAAFGANLGELTTDQTLVTEQLFSSTRKLKSYETPESRELYLLKWFKYYNPYSVKELLIYR